MRVSKPLLKQAKRLVEISKKMSKSNAAKLKRLRRKDIVHSLWGRL